MSADDIERVTNEHFHGQPQRTMRQARIDLSTPIEQKLREALRAIEEGPADVRMTKASTLVSEALTWVGSYVDEQLRGVVK